MSPETQLWRTLCGLVVTSKKSHRMQLRKLNRYVLVWLPLRRLKLKSLVRVHENAATIAGSVFLLLGLCQCIPNSAWMSGSFMSPFDIFWRRLGPMVRQGRPLSYRMALAV